jgi:hypothetical protein
MSSVSLASTGDQWVTPRGERVRSAARFGHAAERGEGGRVARDSHPTTVITRGGTFGPVCPCDDARIGATTSAAGLPVRAVRGVGPLGFAAQSFDWCALVVSSFEAQQNTLGSRICQIGLLKNSEKTSSKST